jgi:uncharacterized coiled-coil protein SlyX
MMGREDKGKMSSKRDRYWSVMLVGDHGRVIPFRHFKGLALAFCAAFLLILTAFIVIAFFYAKQIKTIAALESQIAEANLQNSKLRDEKDLYLTKLTLQENRQQDKPKAGAFPAPSKEKPEPPPVVGKVQKSPPAEPAAQQRPASKQAAVKKQVPKVKRKAEIRKFSVSYDRQREVLRAQFRIYNKSKPKKPLAGRSAVVFKHLDEPPMKWLPVPAVALSSGKPTGDKGQAFQIRNYLTMKFRAYRQKAPIQYNSVTAYVFSNDGQLLTSKDFAVNINVPPPVTKNPVKTPPRSAEAETPKLPEPALLQRTEGAFTKPVAPALPQPADGGPPATPSDSLDASTRDGRTATASEPFVQGDRNTDAADMSPHSEGRHADLPAVQESINGSQPKGPAASDRPSGSLRSENSPGDDAQKPPSTARDTNEAAPKPKIEGGTR